MPYPYNGRFPTIEEWNGDSKVWQDSAALFDSRISDPLLREIDSFVNAYWDHDLRTIRQDTLVYLRSALKFWLKNINKTPRNRPPTLSNTMGGGAGGVASLPTSTKVDGRSNRAEAVTALLATTETILGLLFNCLPNLLDAQIVVAYGAANHGAGNDPQQIQQHTQAGLTVEFLANKAVQRMYKLRFRGGVAYRWLPDTNDYGVLNTDDLVNEQELGAGDRRIHFVMSETGAIYCGFNRGVDWMKHSSLVGGANALSAGRMQVQNGYVRKIVNDSGHYQPTNVHMRNLLRRLKVYGAPVGAVEVMRYNDRQTFTGADMLRFNTWPDGQA